MRSLALTLLVVIPFVARASGTPVDVTGDYHSNYEDVRLDQRGDRVHGTYTCCGGGTIDGKVRGRILRYRWDGSNGDKGHGVWHIDSDRLDGTWGTLDSEDDGGAWNLERFTQIAN